MIVKGGDNSKLPPKKSNTKLFQFSEISGDFPTKITDFFNDTHQRLPDATHDRAVGEVARPEGIWVVDQIGHFRHLRHFGYQEMMRTSEKLDHRNQGSDLGEHGIHPGRLTWTIMMEVWKIIFLSKWVICRFHSMLIFQGVFENIWNHLGGIEDKTNGEDEDFWLVLVFIGFLIWRPLRSPIPIECP